MGREEEARAEAEEGPQDKPKVLSGFLGKENCLKGSIRNQ